MITKYSPNFSKKRRKNKDIKAIVIHYTGMQSEIVAIKRLSNFKSKVSCHYLINRKGQILKMVDENKIAWHAGKSKWKNLNNLNNCSIGIELVNKGHDFGYEKFTDIQINQLIKLCKNLKKKYRIKNSNIVGHSDIAPCRKKDPGEKFPWKHLSRYKVGIWYNLTKNDLKLRNIEATNNEKKLFFLYLKKIGYCLKKKHSENSNYVIKAFQRRYRPKIINGKIDKECLKIAKNLIKLGLN